MPIIIKKRHKIEKKRKESVPINDNKAHKPNKKKTKKREKDVEKKKAHRTNTRSFI